MSLSVWGGLCMCLQRLKVDARSLAARVAGGCKSPNLGSGEPNCTHLQEHYAVLTTEPPLQLPLPITSLFFSFFFY